jgi:hypothetical protein
VGDSNSLYHLDYRVINITNDSREDQTMRDKGDNLMGRRHNKICQREQHQNMNRYG